MQLYSTTERERDEYALPDVEIFYADENLVKEWEEEWDNVDIGWYWWFCFPGCLPDSLPTGPFVSKVEAYNNLRGEIEA